MAVNWSWSFTHHILPLNTKSRFPSPCSSCQPAPSTSIFFTWHVADYLISGRIVNLSGETLRFSVASKEVFCLIQTQAENLSIQVIVLVPQFMVFLSEKMADGKISSYKIELIRFFRRLLRCWNDTTMFFFFYLSQAFDFMLKLDLACSSTEFRQGVSTTPGFLRF